MEKGLKIYLLGYIIAFAMGINHIQHINEKYNRKLTYGNIVFTTIISSASWLDVLVLGFMELNELDIWNKEVGA